MKQFIDGLLGKMTQDEKIGQLNLVSVGFDVTGPVVSKDVDANIRKGLVGGVFNTFTPVAGVPFTSLKDDMTDPTPASTAAW